MLAFRYLWLMNVSSEVNRKPTLNREQRDRLKQERRRKFCTSLAGSFFLLTLPGTPACGPAGAATESLNASSPETAPRTLVWGRQLRALSLRPQPTGTIRVFGDRSNHYTEEWGSSRETSLLSSAGNTSQASGDTHPSREAAPEPSVAEECSVSSTP